MRSQHTVRSSASRAGTEPRPQAQTVVRAARRATTEMLESRLLLTADGPRVVEFSTQPGEQVHGDGYVMDMGFDEPLGVMHDTSFILTNDADPSTPIVASDFSGRWQLPQSFVHGVYPAAPGNYTLRTGQYLYDNDTYLPLDGEFNGTLPSGDGQPGGDFVVHFPIVAPTTRPVGATGLTAHPLSDHEIELAWTPNNGVYRVQRAEGTGDFVDLPSAPLQQFGGQFLYVDPNAEPDKTYRYRVVETTYSGDAMVYAQPSNEAVAQVLPPDLTLPVTDFSELTTVGVPEHNGGPESKVVVTSDGAGYFSAYQNQTTRTLWKTDGTAAGTSPVTDITGSISRITAVGNLIYFEVGGQSIWRSDGTAAGTQPSPIPWSALVHANVDGLVMTSVGNDAIYTASDTSGSHLYRASANGSAPTIVATFSGVAGNPVSMGGAVYFTVVDASGTELWTSDGTSAGTVKIAGIGPAPEVPTKPQQLTVAGNQLFFFAYDGRELCVSDGTTAGTQMIKDGFEYNSTHALHVAGNSVYFQVGQSQTWKSDGTSAGTTSSSIFFSYGSVHSVAIGDSMVYGKPDQTYSSDLTSLWITDGSTETMLWQAPNSNESIIDTTVFQGNVYFLATHLGMTELWMVGATAASAQLVTTLPAEQNVDPIMGGASSGALAPMGNQLLFAGVNQDGRAVWSSDGTSGGTHLLKVTREQVVGVYPDWLTNVNGTIYFTLSTLGDSTDSTFGYGTGLELWKTDGTLAGTQEVFAGRSRELMNVNGTLYFSGYDDQHGYELYKTDGTTAGTVMVADIAPGVASSDPRVLGAVGSRLFFAVRSGSTWQLWKSDGTSATTSQIGTTNVYLDAEPETSFKARQLYAVAGSNLYFRKANADGSDSGELWSTNGTSTTHITGITDPTRLTTFNGNLLLSAVGSSGWPALYRVTAGASAATFLSDAEPMDYATLNGVEYLIDGRGTGGALWKTDGTAAGTKSVVAGIDIEGSLSQLTATADALYAYESNGGVTLVKITPSSGAVTPVGPVNEQPNEHPNYLLSTSSKAVYTDGTELWLSDGTFNGTQEVASTGFESNEGYYVGTDLNPQSTPNGGADALMVGDKIFFTSGDGNGRTLRVATLTAPAAPSGLDETSAVQTPQAAPLQAAALKSGTVAPAAMMLSAAAITASGGAHLTWKDNAQNETGYVVDRIAQGSAVPDESFFVAADSTTYDDPAGVTGDVYRVRAYNAGGYSAAATTTLPPYTVGTTSDNLVSFEAEGFDTNTSRKSRYWIQTSSSSYSGGSAMQVLPNNGVNVTSSIESNSPELDYNINFTKTGTYYVWIRGIGPTGSDDTVNVGLDGKVQSSADRMNGFSSTGNWSKSTMDNSSATIKISKAGVHTLNLFMREDGFIADKILLTTNSKYTPSGTGPTVSPRGAGTSPSPTPTPSPSPSPTPTPTKVTLATTADAYVRAGSLAKTNFGNDTSLLVKQTSDAERVRQSYITFDLTSLSTITSAKLLLYGSIGATDGTITVGVSGISGKTFVEGNGGADNNPSGELTWNNKPSAGSVISKTTMSGTTSQWYTWDVTSFLKSEKAAGQKSATFLIAGTAETTTAVATFASRDSGANAPQLLINS